MQALAALRILVAVLAIGTAGCWAQTAPPPPGSKATRELQEELAAARAKWKVKGSLDYVMRYVRGADYYEDFFQPVKVTVAGGAVAEIVIQASGAPAQGSNTHRIRTVEQAFDRIEKAYAEKSIMPFEPITYDQVLGFPTKVVFTLRPEYYLRVADYSGPSFEIDILELPTGVARYPPQAKPTPVQTGEPSGLSGSELQAFQAATKWIEENVTPAERPKEYKFLYSIFGLPYPAEARP